jgi:4-aminobutyrate aminotransferase/(S)-3-amino-2-methylpropionate transaminase
MEELQLNSRADVIGQRVIERFRQLRKRFPSHVGDVRGLGAMVAMELVTEGDVNQPASKMTKAILAACVTRGLLVIGAGLHGNVIRFLAPLVITDEQLDRGLNILVEEATAVMTKQP